jgi:hypothetical protein
MKILKKEGFEIKRMKGTKKVKRIGFWRNVD